MSAPPPEDLPVLAYRPGQPEEGPRRSPRRGRRSAVRRLVRVPDGWPLLVAGVLVFVTPVPLGLAMIAIAAMALLRHSPRRGWTRGRLWRRFPGKAASGRSAQYRVRNRPRRAASTAGRTRGLP